MEQISARTGADYDRTAVNLLRQAHGKVLPVIAQVRSGTRNDLIRSFAQTGNNVVMKHMTLLESIGKVNYEELLEPVMPAVEPTPIGGWRGSVILIVLAVVFVVGVPAAIKIIRLR